MNLSSTMRASQLLIVLLQVSLVAAFLISNPIHTSSISSTNLMGIRGFRSWFESQFPDAITCVKNNNYQTEQTETFDHVLVDMNQLIHICVRKSRSDGHALVLLLKELDAVVSVACPQKSLVLAMDGPPPAAKLATQRRRRYSLLKKVEWRLNNLQKIKLLKAKEVTSKKKRAVADTRTLCITPGTEFMERAHQAVMYWTWQRLDSPTSVLTKNKVKIYLSPSTVHGEGEVKLLQWIYDRRIPKQESIAIVGGDSDLVLEGLIIPLTISHDVFVLLPDSNVQTIVVSLWETTRSLNARLPHHNIIHLRTDLVLLLILNGNDYLPKLRGSSGFQKLFKTYLELQERMPGHLVDPDSLELQLPFCIAFFQQLAESLADSTYWALQQKGDARPSEESLSRLYNYVDAGYIPRPVKFSVSRYDDDDDDDIDGTDCLESDGPSTATPSNDAELAGRVTAGGEGSVLVQLHLGDPQSDNYYMYETWQNKTTTYKTAKQDLARMAIADIMDFDDDASVDDDDDHELGENEAYTWELRVAAEAKVDKYLYGLLWNLQTYQDGICADYAFNYGRRHAPTASDIVAFLQSSLDQNKTVGIATLNQKQFSPAMNAGVSCLAALPSTVKHLVPMPYRLIPNETVEEIYTMCVDSVDNTFDSDRFQQLCDEQLVSLGESTGLNQTTSQLLSPESAWTVLTRVDKPMSCSFDPPAPFSKKLFKLRPNNRVKVTHFPQLKEPRPRRMSDELKEDGVQENERKSGQAIPREIRHSDLPPFMLELDTLELVRYKKAYTQRSATKGSSPSSKKRAKASDTESASSRRMVPTNSKHLPKNKSEATP